MIKAISLGLLCSLFVIAFNSFCKTSNRIPEKVRFFLPTVCITVGVFLLLESLYSASALFYILRIPFGIHLAYLILLLISRRKAGKIYWFSLFFTFSALFSLIVCRKLTLSNHTVIPYSWMEFCAMTLPLFLSAEIYRDSIWPLWVSKSLRILFVLLSPVYMFIICESVSNHALQILNHRSIPVNLMIYAMVSAVVLCLVGIQSLSFFPLFLFAFILGTANHFVILFRNAPILPVDILAIKTAATVAGNYPFRISVSLLFSGILTLLVCIAGFVLYPMPQKDFTLKLPFCRIAAHLIAAGVATFVVITFIRDFSLEKHCSIEPVLWNPVATFEEHGTAAALTAFYQASIVRKPAGYSTETIRRNLLGNSGQSTAGNPLPSEVKPSVIVVMNESFADLSAIGPINCVKNDLSCLYALAEDPGTIEYGYNYVSTRGGETARSEFEFLTGFSLAYMPGTMPYLQYDFTDIPTIASNAAAQGYHSIAMHPYYPDNWRRSTVYPKMGFARFYAMDDFIGYPILTWDRVSDDGNYKKIIEVFDESEKPLFLYNVTLQNHGPYIPDGLNEAGYPLVEIDETYRQYTDVQVYETLMDNSDKAFARLLDYFRQSSKPVIICFFGDHQAALNTNFEKHLLASGTLPEDSDISLQEKYYTVPYLIWANYDVPRIGSSYIPQTSTNYLGALVQYYGKR